jgi:hypothetical protein
MTNMDPGTNPPRYRRKSSNYTGWIIGAVAALAVIVAIAYGMSDHGSTDAGRTAGTPHLRRPDRAAKHQVARHLTARLRAAHRPVLQRPTDNPFRAQLDPASAGYFFGDALEAGFVRTIDYADL